MAFRILTVGVCDTIVTLLRSTCQKAEIENLRTADEFFNAIERNLNESYSMIVCSSLPELPATELAQSLRMQAKLTPLIYVSPEGHHEEAKDLAKNGFDKAYFYPMDRHLLEAFCRRTERLSTGESNIVFRSVPIVDLDEGSKVDFEVYVHLPKNNKYVKIIKSGAEIRADQLNKLKSSGVNALFLDEADMERFCEYAASKLKGLLQDDDAEPTVVKQEKLQTAARNMFVDLLSPTEATFDEGKEKLSSTHKIIESLLGNHIKDIKNSLLEILSGDGVDIYAHSLRVSSMAALFSLALKIGNPEELAISGLFHDLGLVKIPERLWFQDVEKMSAEDRELYCQHGAKSLALVLEKKMVLFPSIQEAILQHHEMHNGKGYPKGLPGHKVSTLAQILTLADRLEELTSKRLGASALTPLEALEKIKSEGSTQPQLIESARTLLPSKAA